MPTEPRPHLTLPDSEARLRARQPAVRLVLPRVLRRVIRRDRDVGAWGWKVPHRKSFTLPRESLLEIVDRDELGPDPDESLPVRVILLPRPSSDWLADVPAEEVLVEYWRLLLHACVHAALEQRIAQGARPCPGPASRPAHRAGSLRRDPHRARAGGPSPPSARRSHRVRGVRRRLSRAQTLRSRLPPAILPRD